MPFTCTRVALFSKLMELSPQSWDIRYKHADQHIESSFSDLTDSDLKVVRKEARGIYSKIKTKYEGCKRNKERFLDTNQEWLNCLVTITVPSTPARQSQGGRPESNLAECSDSIKRRKVKDLREGTDTDELVFAAQMNLRSDGRTEEAKLFSEATMTTPTRAKKINTAWAAATTSSGITRYTPHEALALVLDAGLSKHSYQAVRSQAKCRGVDLYPSYNHMRVAKTECYPSKEHIKIGESCCEIKLQAILDHTTSRILDIQSDVLCTLTPNQLQELRLVSKWGCDGSGNHSLYKQCSTDSDVFSDSDVFLICLVPLQLYANDSASKQVVWQNPRPSSTRLCRPIKFLFAKETEELIFREKAAMDEQIKSLLPTEVHVSRVPTFVRVYHDLCLTMIDGKTCNAVCATASAERCNLCGATPVIMNDVHKLLGRSVNESVLEYGLSTLHAYIRFFEWLYHVSARLVTKKWHKTKDVKEQVEARELYIQKEFRSRMGVLVGVVLQGKGTTHDGNTARRFFENPSVSADITGLSEDLVHRCAVILRTMSCGYEVQAAAFRKYALDTYRFYVSEYAWYPMPGSVHKVLMHGSDVMSVALLPIGMLSEEAQEARNKDFRNFRERKCRKNSRLATNEDLLNGLLVSSDPVISYIRPLPRRKGGNLPTDVISLLKPPQCAPVEGNDEDNDDDDD